MTCDSVGSDRPIVAMQHSSRVRVCSWFLWFMAWFVPNTNIQHKSIII